jgi:uncharacterized membrane protein YkvA (DUF1232 family)
MIRWWRRLKHIAGLMKRQVLLLYFACKDKRTPWYTRLLAVSVAAYAFSPVDLIPDFIPVLGYVDELILLPLAVSLVMKLIPARVLEDARRKTETWRLEKKPVNWIAGFIIVLIWVAAASWLVLQLVKLW